MNPVSGLIGAVIVSIRSDVAQRLLAVAGAVAPEDERPSLLVARCEHLVRTTDMLSGKQIKDVLAAHTRELEARLPAMIRRARSAGLL